MSITYVNKRLQQRLHKWQTTSWFIWSAMRVKNQCAPGPNGHNFPVMYGSLCDQATLLLYSSTCWRSRPHSFTATIRCLVDTSYFSRQYLASGDSVELLLLETDAREGITLFFSIIINWCHDFRYKKRSISFERPLKWAVWRQCHNKKVDMALFCRILSRNKMSMNDEAVYIELPEPARVPF